MALIAIAEVERGILVLTGIVALLNQLVYPLFYTILIDNFYRFNKDYWVFGLLILRNVGIIITTMWSLLKLRVRE